MLRFRACMAVVLCLLLAACDSGAPVAGPTPTATAPPSTAFNELGIEARLPGTAWSDIPYDIPGAEAYGRLSGGNRLFFFAMRTTEEAGSNAELQEYAGSFAGAAMVPPYTIERAEFQGYPSYAVEGILKLPTVDEDYRARVNFFTAHDKVHVVGAGARTAEWSDGGQAQVDTILKSVRVR
jgi:hypothetical protein